MEGFAELDAPEDMAGLSGNKDTREVARENLVGVTGKASVAENVELVRTQYSDSGKNWKLQGSEA